ncbi:MAG: hypothetical protein QXP61_03535, partial [Nitrososphaerales archaeon]
RRLSRRVSTSWACMQTIPVSAVLGIIILAGSFVPVFANTPGVTPDPNNISAGTSTEIVITSNFSGTTSGTFIRAYDPDAAFGDVGFCNAAVTPAGATVWELRKSGTTVTYSLPANSSIRIPFGTGGTFDITRLGGATVNPGGTGGYSWVIIDGPNVADNTNELGLYIFCTIGSEGITPYLGLGTLQVTAPVPVGGELLSIDATALLIAGVFTNSFFMLPFIIATIVSIVVGSIMTGKHHL